MKTYFLKHLLFVAIVSVGTAWSTAAADSEGIFSLSPSSGSYTVSETFEIVVKMHSSEPVTSLKSYISFNPDLVSVSDLRANHGTFAYWWEEEITPGMIKLQSSIPAPGFQGEAEVARFTVQAKQQGTADFAIDPSSLVLTSQDTNILQVQDSFQARFLLAANSASADNPLPSSFLFFAMIAASIMVIIMLVLLIGRKKRNPVQ